jgi:dienelactone hydrolase
VVYGGALHAFHHPPTNPDGTVRTDETYGQTVLPGVGYHARHARRAWNDVVGLLAECLPLELAPV